MRNPFKLIFNLLNKIVKFALRILNAGIIEFQNITDKMRKADLISDISEKTGVPKVDVLVTLEAFFKEVKDALAQGENVYIRGFGSFITKKRAKKIGRNIKKNVAIEIPEHFIPAFKPSKVFQEMVKDSKELHEKLNNG